MASVFAAMGAAGEPITIEHAGKVYAIKPLTVDILQRLSRALIQSEIEARALGLRTAVANGFITADQAAGDLVRFASGLNESGKYSIGSKWFVAMMGDAQEGEIRNLDAKLLLFSLMLGCTVDEVVGLLASKSDEVMAKVNMVLNASVPAPNG
jgi:hypothetical protein